MQKCNKYSGWNWGEGERKNVKECAKNAHFLKSTKNAQKCEKKAKQPPCSCASHHQPKMPFATLLTYCHNLDLAKHTKTHSNMPLLNHPPMFNIQNCNQGASFLHCPSEETWCHFCQECPTNQSLRIPAVWICACTPLFQHLFLWYRLIGDLPCSTKYDNWGATATTLIYDNILQWTRHKGWILQR